ncbi:hypothetical protein DFQ14_101179 [Halopolyspora algeriensis]|uniref:Uncharacterized protein n=1 Tax=Halopolyspora algeriensis TaxID=1500506 RepID=A0A368W449_9ACTN|nr:hypothetical protein [Halopolyspora algeriensis]RCW46840.1 hypothetical protein DFQ14_101179 [Halopolyspora algeriensis]TQM47931.1 hypothetical protein FHU43_2882 [Halopolyspora algeriensis]
MTPTLSPLATLAIAALVITLGYFATCVIWPFKPCKTCHGTGKRHARIVTAFRLCTRCQGTGRRIRIGRHLYNRTTSHRRRRRTRHR